MFSEPGKPLLEDFSRMQMSLLGSNPVNGNLDVGDVRFLSVVASAARQGDGRGGENDRCAHGFLLIADSPDARSRPVLRHRPRRRFVLAPESDPDSPARAMTRPGAWPTLPRMTWARIGTEGDRLLPFALSFAAVLEVLLIHPDYDRRIFVPLALLLPLTLLGRRRFPLAVLVLNMAAWFVIDLESPVNEDPLSLAITLAIAVYSVGAHTAGRRVAVGAALVASLAITGTIADADEGTLVDFIGNATFFFTIFGGLWLAAFHVLPRRPVLRLWLVKGGGNRGHLLLAPSLR